MATPKDLHVDMSVEFEDPEEFETIPPVVQARFPGECGICSDPYQDGDEIFPDGSGGWAAVRCCGDEVGL